MSKCQGCEESSNCLNTVYTGTQVPCISYPSNATLEDIIYLLGDRICRGGGGGGGSIALPSTQVAFGNIAGNGVSGTPDFTFNNTSRIFNLSGGSGFGSGFNLDLINLRYKLGDIASTSGAHVLLDINSSSSAGTVHLGNYDGTLIRLTSTSNTQILLRSGTALSTTSSDLTLTGDDINATKLVLQRTGLSNKKFLSLDSGTGLYEVGDINTLGNGFKFSVDDANSRYIFNKLNTSGTKIVTVDPSGVLGTTTSSGGSVTSVGIIPPVELTASAPITTSGNITLTWNSESQHTVFAAPSSSSGTPAFRLLVSSDIPSLSSLYLPLSGGTLTGDLILNANPTLALGSATKQYVDAIAVGLIIHTAVRVATTVAGTLASSFANGSTIDGVVLATNDRILIKNQAAPAENGAYTVNASGAPTRATDMNSWAEVPEAYFLVLFGTTNAGTSWVCTSLTGGTLGTTAITFSQFASVFTATAGTGITVTGNLISISTSYVGQTSITTLGTIGTGVWNGTPVISSFGGTGLSSYTQGDLLYYNSGTILSKLAKDANTTRYLSNQGSNNNPSWNQINLANGVTGTLPIANGGSGQTSANSALNTFLPTQTGNSGRTLGTDGTNTSWVVSVGSGDVVQEFTGTQVANQVPYWTSSSMEVSKGKSTFTFDPITDVLQAQDLRVNGLSGLEWGFGIYSSTGLANRVSAVSKGDFPIYDGTGVLTQTAGTNGTFLIWDSSTPTGIGTVSFGLLPGNVPGIQSTLVVNRVVETDPGTGLLISAIKNSAYNKSFGTSTSSIPQIGSSLGNTKFLITDTAGKLVTTASAGANYIFNTDTTGKVTIDSGTTGDVNIGINANPKQINIGNSITTTEVNISGGASGGIDLGGAVTTAITIGNKLTTGTIDLGGRDTIGAINIGNNINTDGIINILGGSGNGTLTLANVQPGGSVSIGAGMNSGTISIGGTGANNGLISIAPGTGTQSINIASTSGAKTITIGTTSGSSTITLLGNGGIGLNTTPSGTTFNNLPASTSGKSSIRFGSGVDASIPVEGDLYYLGSQGVLKIVSGGITPVTLTQTLFTSYNDKSVTNTTTETSIIPSNFIGTTSFLSGFWKQGKSIEVTIEGYITTNSSSGNIQIRSRMGASVSLPNSNPIITDTGVQVAPNSLTQSFFRIQYLLTCRSVGISGTFTGTGNFMISPLPGTYTYFPLFNITPVTINTTISNIFDMGVKWGTAHTDNTMVTLNTVIKSFN